MGWNDPRTAPVPAEGVGRFVVTHPFHPLHGREFELLARCHIWNRQVVYYRDDDGRPRSLPVGWTSLAPADPFQVVAEGRACLRQADLEQLAEVIQVLLGAGKRR